MTSAVRGYCQARAWSSSTVPKLEHWGKVLGARWPGEVGDNLGEASGVEGAAGRGSALKTPIERDLV